MSSSSSDREDTYDVPVPAAEGTSGTSGSGKKVITRQSRSRRALRRVIPLGRYLPKPNTDGASSSSSTPLPVTVGREEVRPTHVEDGRRIVVPQGDGFIPSKPAATAIINSIQQHFEKGWPDWTAVKKDSKKPNSKNYYKAMLDSFLEQCTWLPEEQEDVEYAFNKRCSHRYSELMRTARAMGTKPPYMGPEAYAALEDYWRSDKFKNKQEKAKQNRASERGCCVHAGGSVSAGTHHQRMEDELRRPVGLPELHRNLNMREEDESYVNPRAQRIQDAFDAGMAEWRQSQQQSSGSSSVDPVEESRVARSIWDTAVGPHKTDRLPGSGSMGPKLFKDSILPRRSHSTSESTGRSYVAPNSYVEELTQQFNQRLNEQAEQYARRLQEAEERNAEREERNAERTRRMEEQMQQMMALMNQQASSSSSSSSSQMASYQQQQVMGGSFQPWPTSQQQYPPYPQQYPPLHYPQQYPPLHYSQQYPHSQQQYPHSQQQYPPRQQERAYQPHQQFRPSQQQSPPFNNIDLNFSLFNELEATLMRDDFQPPPGPAGGTIHRDEEDDDASE